ncbi:hypothetical protein [Bradyrhizobium sp. AZCC 2176]|uniref:hypothetical protein n=1 Tax=Bradyrhizobium sp. AZCC 2176 TaxID=3117025 RepID=UPI002FEF5D9C
MREPRGPKVRKPRLYLKKAKAPKGWPKDAPYGTYYIYHYKKDYSTGCNQDQKEEADDKYQEFCRDVRLGRKAREAPGQITFAEIIASGLARLKRNANTPRKLAAFATAQRQSVWWLQHFGKMKLIDYRPGDSDEFQTWYVGCRSAAYLRNPDRRGSAANGANVLLRALKSFTQDFARDENMGWYPDIKIPEGEQIPPGPFFRRSEQAALLLACRGWVKDRKTGKWKTRTYVDANGVTRTTRVVRPAWIIAARKGKSRFIRLGVRTGAREQDLLGVVWGLAPHTTCVEVDDDGAGMFHRRGTEEVETNKSRPSSLVPDRLRCLLRIWKKEDGQSKRVTQRDRENGTVRKKQRYLIRKKNDKHYSSLSLASVVKDAGLPANYTEHSLRRTAVEEAHLQCWSLATATHMIGMTAEILLKSYTDWNERAARSEAQALREANSKQKARALRDVEYTMPEDSDRVRFYARAIARLKAKRLQEECAEAPADAMAEAEEALAALRAANRGLAAHRLRMDDLAEVPAADAGSIAYASAPFDDVAAKFAATP